ncbi:myeloid cell surface antigen CD33-like [Macrotis lagotis]|uniref:myeloid cell surface antigen CD33-like n=1 Tax=Macrotis lagotis TaxID=92651 RepID=UPI003D6904E1
MREIKIHIQEKKVTVQEGRCISIPCSFNFSQYQNKNKTYGYWFQRKDKDKLVATNDCQKEIHSEAQGRFHLSGDLQKDNCSLSISGIQKWDGGKYWFQVEKGNLSKNFSHEIVSVHVEDLSSSKLLFTPKAQDHGTNLTCRVTFPETKGTTETTVQLRVASSLGLIFTLLRGALMAASFLLTYGFTWLYYTRQPLGREHPLAHWVEGAP